MYDRFTDRARKVMQLANQEAQRFNHEYIGTEHVLLGLVKEAHGVAGNVLRQMGVDLKKVRLEVEKIVKPGPDMVTMGKMPQTGRCKAVIQYAIEQARELKHNYVGTEHLLLGLLLEHEGVAYDVLNHLGIDHHKTREAVLDLLGRPQDDMLKAEASKLEITHPGSGEITINLEPRYRVMTISAELLLGTFQGMTLKNQVQDGKAYLSVCEGLPEDVKVVAMNADFMTNTVQLKLWSSTFAPVKSCCVIPSFNVQFSRHFIKLDKDDLAKAKKEAPWAWGGTEITADQVYSWYGVPKELIQPDPAQSSYAIHTSRPLMRSKSADLKPAKLQEVNVTTKDYTADEDIGAGQVVMETPWGVSLLREGHPPRGVACHNAKKGEKVTVVPHTGPGTVEVVKPNFMGGTAYWEPESGPAEDSFARAAADHAERSKPEPVTCLPEGLGVKRPKCEDDPDGPVGPAGPKYQLSVRWKCGCCVKVPYDIAPSGPLFIVAGRALTKCDMANGCYYDEAGVHEALVEAANWPSPLADPVAYKADPRRVEHLTALGLTWEPELRS